MYARNFYDCLSAMATYLIVRVSPVQCIGLKWLLRPPRKIDIGTVVCATNTTEKLTGC